MAHFNVRVRSEVFREHSILPRISLFCYLWHLTLKIISLCLKGITGVSSLVRSLKWLVEEEAETLLSMSTKIKRENVGGGA